MSGLEKGSMATQLAYIDACLMTMGWKESALALGDLPAEFVKGKRTCADVRKEMGERIAALYTHFDLIQQDVKTLGQLQKKVLEAYAEEFCDEDQISGTGSAWTDDKKRDAKKTELEKAYNKFFQYLEKKEREEGRAMELLKRTAPSDTSPGAGAAAGPMAAAASKRPGAPHSLDSGVPETRV